MDKRLKNIISRLEIFETEIKDNDIRLKKLQYAWEIGRDACQYKKETGTPINEIGRECGIMESTMQRFVRFYRFYPKGYKESIGGKPLMWGHYMAVMYLRTHKEREWYLKEAAASGWSTHEMRRRVRNNFYESATDAAASGGGKEAQVLCSRDQQLYTYSAKVLKVVDGDTLNVEVDVGFSMRYETKIRLRGIDCPERGTKKGEAAKKFVEDELLGKTLSHYDTTALSSASDSSGLEVQCPSALVSQCQGIVIRSYKSEKYGRFLADVWYLNGETDPEVILKKGKMLNQVLLDKSYAQKVE
jgi:micrococcal nuclease